MMDSQNDYKLGFLWGNWGEWEIVEEYIICEKTTDFFNLFICSVMGLLHALENHVFVF